MAEIIFDTFDPDPSCYNAPPTNPQQQDPCTIKVSFHLRDEKTPVDPILSFRRSQDRFVLETQFRELQVGLLKSTGFSEDSPLLQSSLFYSIALNRWMEDNYPGFVQENKYKGQDLLPLGKRVLSFILSGSIEKPDPEQIAYGAVLLKEILDLSPEGRIFFTKIVEILKRNKTGVIRKEVEPRAAWLLELLTAYEKTQKDLPKWKAKDPLRDPLEKSTISLLVYLGIGEGKMEDVISQIDAWVPQAQSREDFSQRAKDYYQHLLWNLPDLKKTDFFKNNAAGKDRMAKAEAALKAAVDEHRAELLSLSPQKAFDRSLELKLIDAAFADDLTLLVKDDLKSANLSASWLRREATIQEMAEAILPALKWTPDAKGPGQIEVDVIKLQSHINKMIGSHGIQEREFMIGSLAALRFLFGKTLAAVEMKAWVKNKYVSIPVQISETDREQLLNFGKKLEKNIARSVRKTSIFLPIGEAAGCLGGFAVAGGGLSEDSRGAIVGGSTLAGVGCGGLLTHYVYPTRNPYISDGVGAVIVGAVAFGLSFWLTGSRGDNGDPGRNPTTGYGP